MRARLWMVLEFAGALILAAIAGGLLLPVKHVAAREALLPQPPEALWKTLVEVEASPAWRPGLARVERLEDRYGNLTWRETDRRGRGITYEATESIPPHRQVRTIIERNAPFGGNWVIEVEPAGAGSRVRITEHGEIYNPVFRLLARFVLGYTSAMDEFLRDLGRKAAS